MFRCSGNGECINPCVCEIPCENGYCKSDCCALIKCRNYKFCKTKLPQRYIINGIDIGCAIKMGPHFETKKINTCCVCMENKQMLVLKCRHEICNDCWYIISNKSPICPLCRNKNSY